MGRLLAICCALAVSVPAMLLAEDVSGQNQEAAKQRKAQAVAALKEAITVLESGRLQAAKQRDATRAKELARQVAAKKGELGAAIRQSLEDYAAEIAREKAEAVAAEKREKELAKNPKPAQPGNRRPQLAEAVVAELGEAGPLGIVSCLLDNSTRLIMEEVGPRAFDTGPINSFPVLRVTVTATSDNPVESFEVACNAYDSFKAKIAQTNGDTVFTERYTFKPDSPLLKGQTKEVRFYFSRKPQSEAYECEAWVSKVRLRDGAVIERSKEDAAAKKAGIVRSQKKKSD